MSQNEQSKPPSTRRARGAVVPGLAGPADAASRPVAPGLAGSGAAPVLPIAEVAERTGVGVATLRQWEHRYGFPAPSRLAGGHRRYSEADVASVRRVLAERAAGRTLEAAIALARAATLSGGGGPAGEGGPAAPPTTIFAGLRSRRPDLAPVLLDRAAMLAVSRAIEDECMAGGARAHLAVAFQLASRYRAARRRRWDGLSRMAASTLVFADFRRSRRRPDGVVEVAIARGAPQEREWAVVCDAPGPAAVLAGWERADGRFEAVWTVDPSAVRSATEVARAIAEQAAPGLDTGAVPDWRVADPDPTLARAVAVANRAVGYLGEIRRPR